LPFQSIEPQRLYEQVADQIGSLVTSGEYKPGDRLPPERDLARRLGVSRPILREAMVALEIAGLVEVRMGAGTFVKKTRAAPVRLSAGPGPLELLTARRLIEGEVASFAAGLASEIDTSALRQLNAALRREIDAGRTGVEADRAFHIRLARTTRNGLLVDIVEHLWEGMIGPMLNRFHEITNQLGKHRTNIEDHEAIVAALARNDAEAARAAMIAHINHVETILLDDLT
jgi:DNA-binding FadR family transcriptional regulator